MRTVGRISVAVRNIASILLAICFVLPLSRCTYQSNDGGKTMTPGSGSQFVTDQYGYDMIREAGKKTVTDERLSGALQICAAILAFFLPMMAMYFSPVIRATLVVTVAPFAEYLFSFWTYFFAEPRYGGFLALSCWPILFVLGIAELWTHWRIRRIQKLLTA